MSPRKRIQKPIVHQITGPDAGEYSARPRRTPRDREDARRVAFSDIQKWFSAFPTPPSRRSRRRSPAPPPPSPPPLPVIEEDEALITFAATLPFTLTFSTIEYPMWANEQEKPLNYLPIPLRPLAGVPAVPSQIDISFSQIMDTDLFLDTIDGLLAVAGYKHLSRQNT